MEKEGVLALLRIHGLSCGGDICDRCGEVIWPEIELVRCDFCVGLNGPPAQERIHAAYEKHRARIFALKHEEDWVNHAE